MQHIAASLLLAGAFAVFPAAADNPAARSTTLSSPDCASPSDFVVQYDPAPKNRTYMRVQHMGDVGTLEQAQQVAHAVTWDVGQVSGLHAPSAAQRGYRDEGLPVGASAFQLACGSAGFL